MIINDIIRKKRDGDALNDDEIAFFPKRFVVRLRVDPRLRLLRRRMIAPHDAFDAALFRRFHAPDLIGQRVRAAFEQKRHVNHGKARSFFFKTRKLAPHGVQNHRMQNRVKFFPLGGIRKHELCQRTAIHFAVQASSRLPVSNHAGAETAVSPLYAATVTRQ